MKHRLQINWGNKMKYFPGDSRLLLFRWLSPKHGMGEGWKISVSLHPYWFYWRKGWREFRLTLLGVNIHFKGIGA